MAFTSFRAGSGSYQAVRPLQVNPSAVPANTVSVETFSVAQGNIATSGGSIADLDKDSLVDVQWANPGAASVVGLAIISSALSNKGELQLTTFNPTNATITPAAGIQLNVLVF